MHHTALCYSKSTYTTPLASNISNSNVSAAPPSTSLTQPATSKQIVMPTPTNVTSVDTTAPVRLRPSVTPTAKVILSRNNSKVTTTVFLDSGSRRSFISPKLIEKMQLPMVGKFPFV